MMAAEAPTAAGGSITRKLDSLSHDFHTKASYVLTAFFLVSLGLLSLVFSDTTQHDSSHHHRLLEQGGSDYSGYSCNQIHKETVNGEEQCQFAKTCNGGEGVFAPFVFCHSYSPSVYCWIMSPVLLLWLITLFRMLGSTAEYYFSPSLEMFSGKLGLPPRFAGVTLLALGNGAADVSATVNAITSDEQNGYKLSLGALTGAAMFIGAIVAGSVMVVAGGVPCRGALVRDVMALLITVIVVAFKLKSGVIGPAAITLFVSMYIFFVMIVLVADVYHRAVVVKRLELARERQRQIVEGQLASDAAGDALNELAAQEIEIPRGNLANRAIDSVLVALSNYGSSPLQQDGWGVESQDIANARPVVLHGAHGLLHEDDHPHQHRDKSPQESEDSTPYTAMLESGIDQMCVEPGSFSASNWSGCLA